MANQMDEPTRKNLSDGHRSNGRAFARVSHILRLAAVATLAVALLTNPALTPGLQAQSGGASGNTPPPTVVVAPVVSRAVAEEAQFTGRIQAIQSVDVQARVEGYLQQVAFKEGSNVKTGDLLYQIEKGPYEADLAQAEAQLASAKAQLASAQANLNNAEINVQRQQTLVQRDTVSQAVVDDAVAQRDTAKANVEAANAAIQNAQAQIQSAQLNLGYTTIKAPIDGRLGRTYVTIGNLISQASGTMATLVQLNPIRVAFSVPDTLYTSLVEDNSVPTDTRPGTLFTPSLQLPNGKIYDQKGTITFASNEIDASTGTITVYADFANPNAVLLPGAFVVVKVEQAETTREPVILASAVVQDRQGDYVFVLNSDDVVETRRVTLGRRTASEVAVTEGLAEGETIVVQGVQKIRPGMKVTPSPMKTDTAAQSKTPFESTDDPEATLSPSNEPTGMGGSAPSGDSGAGSGSSPSTPASGGASTSTDAAAPASSGGGAAAPSPAASATTGDAGGSTAAAPAAVETPAASQPAPAASDASASNTSASEATDAQAAAPSDPAPADDTTAAPAAPTADSAPDAAASTTAPADTSATTSSSSQAAGDAAPAATPDASATGSDTADPAAAAAPADTAPPSDSETAATDPASGTATDGASAPAADAGDDEDDLAGPVTGDSNNPAAVRGSGAQANAPLYNATPLPRPGDQSAPAQTPASGN